MPRLKAPAKPPRPQTGYLDELLNFIAEFDRLYMAQFDRIFANDPESRPFQERFPLLFYLMTRLAADADSSRTPQIQPEDGEY